MQALERRALHQVELRLSVHVVVLAVEALRLVLRQAHVLKQLQLLRLHVLVVGGGCEDMRR